MVNPTKEWFENMFRDAESDEGDKWGHRWKGSQKHRHALCLKMLKPYLRQDNIILDIGCAVADFTRGLYANSLSKEVYGVDISEKATGIASKLHPEIHFKNGALPHLGFATDRFDLITALEVVGYLDGESRRLAFQNIHRMMQPGGHLLFSGGINRGKDYFEPDEIVRLIGEYFEVVEVKYNYGHLGKKLKSIYNIKSKFVAAILAKITKWIMGQKGATHIFILARKT